LAAHWLRAVVIGGLAILYSEMAGAEQLRLECSLKAECKWLNRRDPTCIPKNPTVSMMVEIDFEAKTWVEIFTAENGAQSSYSGKLTSVTQYEITLKPVYYSADGGARPQPEKISRTSGAYSDVLRGGGPDPAEWTVSGTCNKTTKPLPSAKF